MRFSIRDLLWATALVAMGLGWWATNAKRLEAVGQAKRLHTVLTAVKRDREKTTGVSPLVFTVGDVTVDWRILDEPLVEP
jgi:hypothetical protein